jgi:HEAT repeat protein
MNCAALSVKGHETEFMTRLDSSGKEMTLWGIQVLSKAGSPSAIPFLLRYIFDIDERVSKEAYAALRSITGLDPVRMFGFTENSPETLLVFKLYYQGSIAGISTAGVR